MCSQVTKREIYPSSIRAIFSPAPLNTRNKYTPFDTWKREKTVRLAWHNGLVKSHFVPEDNKVPARERARARENAKDLLQKVLGRYSFVRCFVVTRQSKRGEMEERGREGEDGGGQSLSTVRPKPASLLPSLLRLLRQTPFPRGFPLFHFARNTPRFIAE